jgi:hypothetical protein
VLLLLTGNEEGQLDTELLVARCLAAISRKTQLEQRSMLTGTSNAQSVLYVTYRPTHPPLAIMHTVSRIGHRDLCFSVILLFYC